MTTASLSENIAINVVVKAVDPEDAMLTGKGNGERIASVG